MVTRAARLLAQSALWRATGWRAAGRSLVAALGSHDEDVRTLAGILLVRGGERAEPLLEEALRRRENLPMVVSVLASLEDPRYEPNLRRLAQDPDPQVADAAREGLRLLLDGSRGQSRDR
jgi:hypothetical protein